MNMTLTRVTGAAGLLAALLLFSSCGDSPQGTIVARVGDAVLTREDVARALDTTRVPLDQLLPHYVVQWVNQELLYQEAKRSGVEKDSSFLEAMKGAERQLAVQSYLDRKVEDNSNEPDESTLREYFEKHPEEFVLKEDIVTLNMATWTSREKASAFAASISQGKPWQSALDSLSRGQDVNVVSGAVQTQRTIFPPELWKVVTALSVNEVSFPVKTTTGYAVLQPKAFHREGKAADFFLVKDEVHQRVQLERRRARYDEILAELGKRYPVQVFLGNGQQRDSRDSTEVSLHE